MKGGLTASPTHHQKFIWTELQASTKHYFMFLIKYPIRTIFTFCAGAILTFAATKTSAQTNVPMPVLKINAASVTGKVSPTLYGLMTEEINYSYEGGLYGELIRNRAFKASANGPKFWDSTGNGAMALDPNMPLNDALNVSLKLDASQASATAPAGIANGGYWGIPVRPKTTYHASFYAKMDGSFN